MYKQRLDHEIEKFKFTHMFDYIDLIVVSDEFLKNLLFELDIQPSISEDARPYIVYKNKKIISTSCLTGTTIFPYFNPNKTS